MPTVKIGIQTRSLRQPLRQALATAARLGAAGVEIDARSELRPDDVSRTGLREFHKLLGDMSLRVSAVAFPTRRGYDVPDDIERRVLATQAAMRFAADLRTDVVVVRAGRVPSENEAAWSRLVEAMIALGGYGERITDPAEIIPAIRRGIERTEAGVPVLLEFITCKELASSRHPTRTAQDVKKGGKVAHYV